MRIFVTGGNRVHRLCHPSRSSSGAGLRGGSGLVRSEAGARGAHRPRAHRLHRGGHRGTWRACAAEAAASDGVHPRPPFLHDFLEVGPPSARWIGAPSRPSATALAGSDRRLIVNFGHRAHGARSGRDRGKAASCVHLRRKYLDVASEGSGDGPMAARDVRIVVVTPCAFGPRRRAIHGFVPLLIDLARQKGVSAYVGDGRNRWARGAPTRCRSPLSARRRKRRPPESGCTESPREGVPFPRDRQRHRDGGLNLPVVGKNRQGGGRPLRLVRSISRPSTTRASSKTDRGSCWGGQPRTGPGLIADIDSPELLRNQEDPDRAAGRGAGVFFDMAARIRRG